MYTSLFSRFKSFPLAGMFPVEANHRYGSALFPSVTSSPIFQRSFTRRPEAGCPWCAAYALTGQDFCHSKVSFTRYSVIHLHYVQLVPLEVYFFGCPIPILQKYRCWMIFRCGQMPRSTWACQLLCSDSPLSSGPFIQGGSRLQGSFPAQCKVKARDLNSNS